MKTLIHNVSVFDGNDPTLLKGANIAIEDDLVTEITAGEVEAEKFDQTIDGKGMTAMPGLIDCHIHMRVRPRQTHGETVCDWTKLRSGPFGSPMRCCFADLLQSGTPGV